MIWRFREFELDDARFELRCHGQRVAIAPKPLQLLIHLAKRQPAAVTHEELLRAVWPGVRVTSASVARAVLAARHALVDGKDADGVIRTIRGRGYAFVSSLTPEPSPEGSLGAYVDSPFVGRHAELARIEAALDNVEVARGRLLFATGEPGIGKSRLLGELAARGLSRGSLVVTGQCREDDGAPPYWPWPEVLRDLWSQCDEPRVRGLLDDAMLDLEPGRPEVQRQTGARVSLADADARFRLFQNVTDALRQAAAGRTLLVLLEDLHWASQGALHLLRFVGRSVAQNSLLIAMTFRSSGPPPNPTLEAAMGELGALSHAVSPPLRLSGFSLDEIRTYVRQTIGETPDEDAILRLHDVAGGNPLFLRELVSLARRRKESGGAEEGISASPSVSHILRSQIERLSEAARDLVEIAAVVGRRISPELLARVSGRPVTGVIDLLREVRGENLIEGERSGVFRFRHDIIRSALLEELRASRRIELHQRVAEAIEAGGEHETHLAELAYHYVEAVPQAGREKAVHYARRAAEAARQALDFDRAAQHYQQALGVLGESGVGKAAERCDLLLDLGEVLEVADQLAQSREAIAEAADLARRMRSIARLSRAALALAAWQQIIVPDPVAVQLIENALREMGRRGTGRARLLARLAVLRRVEGQEDEAKRLIDEALALARQRRDLPLRCDVLLHRLLVVQLGLPGDYGTRLALTDEVLSIAERVGNTYAILQCRRHRISLLLASGAGPELDEEIEHFARESTAARCKRQYLAGFRAMRAIACGRFEGALQAIEETERLADPFSPDDRFGSISHRIDLPPEHRDSEAVARTIQSIIREYPQVVGFRAAHALIALDLGHTETARAALDLFTADDFAGVPRGLDHVVILTAMAMVSWRLAEPRHAPRLYELLLPSSGTQATTGTGMAYQGPVDWYLGVLGVMQGRRREAAHHFETALATTTRLGAWPWYARTEVAYASLLATGTAAQRKRARSLAASAAQAAARFGMHSLRAEAEKLQAK